MPSQTIEITQPNQIDIDPELFKVRLNKYIPVEPTPKQFALLLLNDIKEVFYGGAGGGGKTIALLMAGLQYIDQPDYNAILFRQSYKQLSMPGGLLDTALRWLLPHKEIQYNGEKKAFTFPSGATLTFGYLQAENDKYNYQTAEFQYIGFDELTDFSESQYLFLFSRLRRKEGSNIPLRVRSASNPVGSGFDWVKKRFITERPPDSIFISARLEDNPHIDQKSYIDSLNYLDPITREKILNGDWAVRQEAMMFKPWWFKTIAEKPIGISDMIRVWDKAATSEEENRESGQDACYTAGTLLARLYDKTFCVIEIIRFRGSPKEVEETIKNTAIRDGKFVEIYIEQEPGSAGKDVIDHYARNVLLGWVLYPVSPTGSKVARASPLASSIEKGHIIFLGSALKPEIMDEFLTFPVGRHNDCVDATAHAFNILSQKPIPRYDSSLYKGVYKEEKKFLNWGNNINNEEKLDKNR